MKISFEKLTRPGDRTVNEDYLGFSRKSNSLFFSIADGLGGHGMGDRASKTAVGASIAVYETGDFQGNDMLDECFKEAQLQVLDVQNKLDKVDSIKTTMVNLLIEKETAYWGHIGDSRLYVIRNKKILMRTSDHSVPQMLYLVGDIKEREIRNHPDRNKLLKVIGVKWDKPKYELCSLPLQIKKGDVFLMCTDGFWELIENRMILKLLKKSTTPKQWLSEVESYIIQKGKNKDMDNYTALAIYIE